MKKYTLITGASSGIGQAFANFFAEKEHNLILVARSENKLQTLKESLTAQFNIDVKIFIYDLTLPNISKRLYSDILDLDIFVNTLINCAGIGLNGFVNDLSYDQQHNEVMLNTVSLFDMTKLFLSPMINHNEGVIINIASTSAYHPIPTMAVYAATKSFVLSFTEALAAECAHTNVKIIAMSPGATDTNFFSNDGGVAYGQLRTPEHVVKQTIMALKQNKISKIDGFNNYVTSMLLPRLLTRKRMVNMVYNIMRNQKAKE